MTYNPAVPLNSDSPSLLPGQCQANFTRLQTVVGADHQFNLGAAANDGFHNLIHMLPQAPTGALAGTGRLYVKIVSGIVQLFYMTSAGVEIQITPPATAAGVFCAINFNGTGTVNNSSIRSSFNVLAGGSIARVPGFTTGAYRLSFNTPASSDNYIVQACGQRHHSDVSRICSGFVISKATYGVSQTTTFVDVAFAGESSFQDVLMGNILIYQV